MAKPIKGHAKETKAPPAPIRGSQLGRQSALELPLPELQDVTDPRKRAYLHELCRTGHFEKAAALAGVSLKTGWNWRADATDLAFQAGLTLALKAHCDRIEAEIVRRAYEGVEEPVYQAGRLVGTVRRFSDTLLIFHAKKLMPEYRDRHAVDVTGSLDLGPATDRIARLLGELAAARGSSTPAREPDAD